MPSSASRDLAHATIPVPRTMTHMGVARVDVFLRATANGRFRWFHDNGTATVVEAATVEQALQVAQFVWSDVEVLRRPESPAS